MPECESAGRVPEIRILDSGACFGWNDLEHGDFVGNDADALAIIADGLVNHNPVCCRKQGEVLTHTDITTGFDMRAMLADQDVAGEHALPAEHLDAQALAMAIATIAAAAAAFFVCHRFLPFSI